MARISEGRLDHLEERSRELTRAEKRIDRVTTERDNWMDTAAQNQRNTDFYQYIVREIGELFGEAARTSDDGSIQDDVLALKVPELVRSQITEVNRYERALRWAFGEDVEGTPEFPIVDGPPYYRWRTQLRLIAGLRPKGIPGVEPKFTPSGSPKSKSVDSSHDHSLNEETDMTLRVDDIRDAVKYYTEAEEMNRTLDMLLAAYPVDGSQKPEGCVFPKCGCTIPFGCGEGTE